MQCKNKCMRDPTLWRVNKIPHHNVLHPVPTKEFLLGHQNKLTQKIIHLSMVNCKSLQILLKTLKINKNPTHKATPIT